MQKMNVTCEYDYTSSNEITTIKSNSTIQQAFQYQSNDQLDAYVSVGDHGSYSLSTGGIYPQFYFEPINFYSKFIFFFAFK